MSYNYKTKVKIDMLKLKEVVESLEKNYMEIGNRETKEGRSRFSMWNNIKSFYDKNYDGEPFKIVDVEGNSTENCARIYNSPSVTSLSKPFRKCIVPLKEGNVFIHFDIVAAEFFMNCVFCGETEAIKEYQEGRDIYTYYLKFLPEGSTRNAAKNTILPFMYDVTPYRVGINLGISDTQAERILEKISTELIGLTMKKMAIIKHARATRTYWAANAFQGGLIPMHKLADGEEFNHRLALSTYVQSALGIYMQNFIELLKPKVSGTILTVFDAVLFEVGPDSVDRAIDWVSKVVKPFLCEVSTGSNYFEAAYESKKTKL